MSFLAFVRAILAQFALFFKKWILLWISYVIFAMNISLFVMLFVFMNIWRWCHSGRVCSGDYLDDKSTADKDVYLITEGKFLKMILLSIYLIFALASCTIFCVACAGRRSEGEEKRTTALNLPIDQDYDQAMRRGSMAGSFMDKDRPN